MARPRSQVAEAFRAVRTSILLSSMEKPPKVLMVTSALPQEGKTTISSNLAAALAQRGGRVLLVDADLRRPRIQKSMQLPFSAMGLSTVLAGTQTAEEAIVQSPELPNLDVLTAGPPPPYPAELLGSQRMKSLIARWRTVYEHVVIDTPPVLSVTDAVSLLGRCGFRCGSRAGWKDYEARTARCPRDSVPGKCPDLRHCPELGSGNSSRVYRYGYYYGYGRYSGQNKYYDEVSEESEVEGVRSE